MKNHKKTKRLIPIIIVLICTIATILVINSKSYSLFDNNSPATSENSINSENTDWRLILVNDDNLLPKDFKISLKTLKNNMKIDERIYPELQDMFDSAKEDNIYLQIDSAFRTKEKQESLFSNKVKAYKSEGYSKKEAKELAGTWVANPGASEHQLGLALDINAQKDKCTNKEAYNWLNSNAYKYGFILRYPTDKADITGVNYEPWHYRYVGKEVAKEIYSKQICLEEYLKG